MVLLACARISIAIGCNLHYSGSNIKRRFETSQEDEQSYETMEIYWNSNVPHQLIWSGDCISNTQFFHFPTRAFYTRVTTGCNLGMVSDIAINFINLGYNRTSDSSSSTYAMPYLWNSKYYFSREIISR